MYCKKFEEINPSFFELTFVMALDYFAQQEVNVAIIETGLGGRLDSTNVITPLLSVITNISYDHTDKSCIITFSVAEGFRMIIKRCSFFSDRQPAVPHFIRSII